MGGEEGEVDVPIGKCDGRMVATAEAGEGRASLTRWRVLEHGFTPHDGTRFARLSMWPLTGCGHFLDTS